MNFTLLAHAVPNFVCRGIKLLKALKKPRVHGSQETTLRSIKFLEYSVNLSECTRVMQIVLIYVCAHDVPPHCNVLVCSTISNSSTSNSRHSTYDIQRARAVFYAFMRHSWSLAILRDGSLGDTMQVSLVAQSLAHSLFVATPLRHWLCVSRDHAHVLFLAAVRCHSDIANAMREPRLPRGRSTSHIQPIVSAGAANVVRACGQTHCRRRRERTRASEKRNRERFTVPVLRRNETETRECSLRIFEDYSRNSVRCPPPS